MINNVTLVGRLTRDPELRYTPQNQVVTTFSLAVNRQFKMQTEIVRLISLIVSSGVNKPKT